MILDERVATKTVRIETNYGTINLKAGHQTPWGVVEIVHPLGDGTWFVGTKWTPGKKLSRRKSARLMDLVWTGSVERLFVAPLLPHSMSGDDKQAMAQTFAAEFGFRKVPGLDTGFPVVLSADNWPPSIPLPQYAVLYRPPAATPHWRNL
ncbi:hypothetical protein [Devosia insulae]|uniref:hypothetical protein n=1 Tax=Devosia insulae TaxID=408174 RepID=UPI00114CA737|nr:hypothetical protein [Devosia insulae]